MHIKEGPTRAFCKPVDIASDSHGFKASDELYGKPYVRKGFPQEGTEDFATLTITMLRLQFIVPLPNREVIQCPVQTPSVQVFGGL
jgi:hypothetical protein